MKVKKLAAWIMSVTLAAAALTGCGNTGASESKESTITPSKETTASAAVAEK